MPRPCGILSLDKPAGPTSHDIVDKVRLLFREKQVGHAGTLDPMATGVLVLGVGPATRLMTFIGGHRKEYVAGLLLGRNTDSEDVTGSTLSEQSASDITREDVEKALTGLRGEILQAPPMVSAVRHEGKRLYELARQGKTVERAPRPVTVYSLELLDFTSGVEASAVLRVQCSGGTYVRTLCADIGTSLGCGGCMSSLRRTAIGPFRIEDTVTLEQIEVMGLAALQPASAAVAHIPAIRLTPDQVLRIIHGGAIMTGQESVGDSNLVRLEDLHGQLVAMANTMETGDGLRCQPFLVLPPAG